MKKIRLGDACDILNGFAFKSENYVDSGIRVIRIANVQKGYIEDNTPVFYPLETNELDKYMLEEGDLLMALTGNVGRVAILKKEFMPAALNQRVACLRLKTDRVAKDYLFHVLNSAFFEQQCIQSSKGVAQKNMSTEWLKDYEIPMYPKEQQELIADILDKTRNIIISRNYELKKLDDLIKARFVEMFGSPVSNPMSWEKRTLKEVCIKLNDGSHFSPESFETGDYKYVTAKNIKFSGFDFSNITYVPEAVHRPIFDRCNPEFEDVLYIKDGATTGVAIVNTLDEEFTLLSSVALLKQDRSIMNGYFLATLLNNKDMYLNIRNNMGGAAITRLTIAKLNAIEIIVPPIELQNQFAAFVAEVDKSKFVELFGDPRDNSMGFEKQKLKDSCIVVTGNTPSRAIAEYYGDYVEWIKTDNIVTG